MNSGTAQAVIGLVISAGGGAFVLAVLQGFRDIRSGARVNQRELMEDIARMKDEVEDDLRWAKRDRDYWRDLAVRRAHQLRLQGITPAVPSPVPPSERYEQQRRQEL